MAKQYPFGRFLIQESSTRQYGVGEIVVQEVGASGDVTLPLTGQSITTTLGIITESNSTSISGQSLTASIGTLLDSVSIGLNGQNISVSLGTLSDSISVPLTGQSVSTSLGTITAITGTFAALTGQNIPVLLGTLSDSISVPLTGQSVSTLLGTITASSGTVAALTGQNISVSLGTLSDSISVPLNGHSISSALGTVTTTADVTVALTGSIVSISISSVVPPATPRSNLRIVTNNATDRSATLTASTTNGTLVAANMKTDSKSEVHRSTGTSVTYTITWSTDEIVGCVALPCTNLSSSATIRVRLYNAAAALVLDSGTNLAVPGYNLDPTGHNVNKFAFGVISKSAVWFDTQPTNIRSCVIDLVDTGNAVGYIDTSRIVVGPYWEPTYNVANGIQIISIDSSNSTETNAGELRVDRGFIRDKLNFNFALLPEVDKSELLQISRYVGTNKNFLVSLFPVTADTYTQDFMIFGKRSNSPITSLRYGYYNSGMEVISW